MKKICYSVVAPIFVLALIMYSCSSENSSSLASASSYRQLKKNTLSSLTQHFHVDASQNWIELTSDKGVTISFSPSSAFSLNGNPVTTGQIDLEFIEIFDNATMAATGKHTMGATPEGKAMLLSGGEFYLNATKNGQQLELNSGFNLAVPALLTDDTGAGNPDMSLWKLAENDSVWIEIPESITSGETNVNLGPPQTITGSDSNVYYTWVDSFGWTNVDVFFDDPREKTTISVAVPTKYNGGNSNVYVHFDGMGNGLSMLDYDTQSNLFFDYSSQFPIGLECHLIFVTESDGQWRYAIKPVTVTANALYNFDMSETTVGSEAELIAAINALP